MKCVFGGEIVLLRVAPYEQTSERKCLQHVWAEIVDMFCVLNFFFCVLQDALFVDLLVALSVMKQTLWRGLVSVSISGEVTSGQ